MSHVWKLRDAFGYLYPGEVQLLQKLAHALPDDAIIVNIGAGAGTSALAFIEARADVTLYTVDIQDTANPLGSLEGERQAFRDAGLSHLLNLNWMQVHGDSKIIGEGWLRGGKPPVDLVFVDGNHDLAGCAGDIETWMPNLVEGGVMAVHDYHKAENDPTENGRTKPYPGVDQAVDEFLAREGCEVIAVVDTTIAFRKAGA